MDLPKRRRDAIAMGSLHYFTGKPCKQGHVAPRQVCGNCTVCHLEGSRKPEVKERQRAYDREYNQGYYKRPEVLLRQREYSKTPAMREWERLYQREYEKTPEYRVYRREFDQRRNADKLKATPPWLTVEQIEEMRSIYAQAARLSAEVGVEYHVDHVVPLRGENVCGLHVPWNLKPMPAYDNRSKGNRFDDWT